MGVRLPSAYQEVEYLQSTGTQYIDTGIIPETYLNAFIDFAPKRNGYPFGSTKSQGNDYFGLNCKTGGSLELYYGDGTYPLVPFWKYNERMQITVNDLKWYKNGQLIYTFNAQSFDTNKSIYLFGLNYSSGVFGSVTIYNFRLWVSDLIIDLVPCYRKSDDKPGMYDLVSGTFFTNAGTGEFTVGPDVIDSISPWLVARRRMLMARVESAAVKLPYLYDRGQFAEEFGGYTIPDPPTSGYRLPDEYYVTPTIYGHYTRNSSNPVNDALYVISNSPVDISSYSSITVDFNITADALGAIFLRDGNDNVVARLNLENITGGHSVLTGELSSPPSNSILKIGVQFWGNTYNTEASINSITLNR